jgi:hypothetical protein
MEYGAFIAFLIWMVVLIILSFLCSSLLRQLFRGRGFRYFLWLGVIVHEYSHALACVLTNTKIYEIKLFEPTGGHVTHQKRNSLITAIISMAPLFGGSLFLLLLAWLFGIVPSYWGANGVVFNPARVNVHTSFYHSFIALVTSVGETLWINIVELFGWTALFFIIFLYLVGSVAACIAPSVDDLKQSTAGLSIFMLVGFFVIRFKPLGYIPGLTAYFGTATPILDVIVHWLSFVLSIGLVGVLLIVVVLVPVALIRVT